MSRRDAIPTESPDNLDLDLSDEWDDDAQDESKRTPKDVDGEPELYYPHLGAWMEDWFLPTIRRRVSERGQGNWNPRWWESPEALCRLEALWRSWEHLRLDPALGMSVWFRDHLDPHLAVLLSSDGPFADATGTNNYGEPLPHQNPPAGLFSDHDPATGAGR